jgi:ApaG protein
MDNDQPVHIDVKTQYLREQSSPEDKRFAFAYTITISNTGDETVQLLSRHWLITDGNAKVQEVIGDGVIGEQPLIEPGHSFRYSSGTLLETAVGSMEGSYQMLSASGQNFDAPIACFSLSQPGSLH